LSAVLGIVLILVPVLERIGGNIEDEEEDEYEYE